MAGTCNTYGGEERRVQAFNGEICGGKKHLEDLGVDENKILN